MSRSLTGDERVVSWKVLLPIKANSRICAVGLGEGELAGLTRSYETVDTKTIECKQYDAVIIGKKTNSDLHISHELFSRLKPDGVLVATNRCRKQLHNVGFKYSRLYAGLPSEQPRLFIPLASRKLRDKGLRFHSPGTFKACVGLAAAEGLNLLGVRWHLMKHVIGIYARDKHALNRRGLIEWLCGKLGYPVIDLVIFAGSESPRRKITALAIAGRQGKDIVVKIGDTKLGTEAIKQESQALKALEDSSLSGQVPRLIWEGQWEGYHTQLQEEVIAVGCKQTVSLTNAHLDFLSKLSRIGRKVMVLKETTTWRNVERLAGAASLNTLPEPIHIALKRVFSDKFADMSVVCHRTHGDFAPWNIKVNKNKLFAYDWEDSLPDGLALTDIFHFLYRQASLVGPWPGSVPLIHDMKKKAVGICGHASYDPISIEVYLVLWLLAEHLNKPSTYLHDMLSHISCISG